jgi:glycosyltransferase involved in cell wall biosynthesis
MKFFRQLVVVAQKFLRLVVPRELYLVIKRLFLFEKLQSNLEFSNVREWRNYRISLHLRNGNVKAESGVNVVGYLNVTKGISEAARNNVLALMSEGIPYTLNNYKVGISKSMQVNEISTPLEKLGFRFNVNLIHINPPQLPYLWNEFNHKDLAARFTIGVWFWELPVFPEEWSFAFDLVDEVWAASKFIYDGIVTHAPVPVEYMSPCIYPEFEPKLSRFDFSLPDDRFLFMCAYDMMSDQERKNPLAAVEAFKKAFPRNHISVGLVIKVNNPQENPRNFRILKNAIAGYENCFLITETYRKKTLNSLIRSIDAYVSLHRSEGFGLIPAEAMSFGKPVVLTRWSGNLDYMTSENSCGVDYELMPVNRVSGLYKGNQVWANPDIDHAAYFMKKLFEDGEYYQRISTHARETIEMKFSPSVVGKKIRKRLTHLDLLG